VNGDGHLLPAFRLKAAVDAGSATPADAQELRRLATDPLLVDTLADDLVVHRLLRHLGQGAGEERFLAGVAVRVASQRDASAFLRRVERRLPVRRRGVRIAAAIAAGLLLAVLVAWPSTRAADGLVITATTGGATLAGEPARIGARVVRGATVTCGVGGRLDLRSTDGSDLTVTGPAECVVQELAPVLSLRLARGTLAAQVAPRPADGPLRVVTPHGEIEVLGTRFTLTVGGITELVVDQGRVRLTDARDGSVVEVVAGGRAVAGTPIAALQEQALAWYTFSEGDGAIVRDRAGRGPPLDLVIADPAAARWLPGGGLRLERPTRLVSPLPAAKVAAACRRSGELTIVVAIEPDPRNATGDPRDYPKRLVSLSSGLEARDVSLSQGLYRGDRRVFDVRLRTSRSSPDGKPSLATAEPLLDPPRSLVIAFSRDRAGRCRYHLDGRPVPSCLVHEQPDGSARRLSPPALVQELAGDLGTWAEDMPLVVGAELEAGPAGTRAWLGTLRRLAFFDRALSDDELAALAR
jgi:ferric-dicitrate binding protein FerR (iron transport regulator)